MKEPEDNNSSFSGEIGRKERLRLKSQRDKQTVWSGLGMFGMVGWSVAVPTLIGVALGIWLNKKFPEHFSWTLTGLLAGLTSGCAIAWNWVSKENRKIHK